MFRLKTINIQRITLSVTTFLLGFLISFAQSGHHDPNHTGTDGHDRFQDSLFLEATGQYLCDQKEKAYENYLRLLEENPHSATSYFQLANLLAEQKKFSQALSFAEKAVALDSSNQWFLLLQAELLKETHLNQKAAEVFKKLQTLDPKNLNFAYERSNMYILSGDINAAIGVYDQLERTYGITETWSMQKYKLYNAVNNQRMARKEIENLHKEFPDNTQYMEILAQIHMSRKEYKPAYSYLKKVLEVKPDDPYVYVSLVDYYRNTGNTRQALASLEKAILNPALDYNTKNSVVFAYFKNENKKNFKGKYEKIWGHYLDLLRKTHPTEGEAQFNYARHLISQNHYQEAIPVLETAIQVAPEQSGCWNLLLLAVYQDNDTSKMKKYAQEALARFPEQSFPYLFTATSAYLDRDFKQAISLANSGIRMTGINDAYTKTMLLQILADSYFETGNIEESVKNYERLLRINPDDVHVKNNYAYFLSLLGKDLELARSIAESNYKQFPDNVTFMDTYAWILYRLGEYKEAKKILERTFSLGGDKEPEILEHYGDILLRLGEKEKALEYWMKALKEKVDKDPLLEEKIRQGKRFE